MIQKSPRLKRPRSHNKLWDHTSEKTSRQKPRQGWQRGSQNRRHHPSFTRWVASFTVDHLQELPEYFVTACARGPKIVPTPGKKIRLELDFFVFLREEGYQIPHFIRDEQTPSIINCRVATAKPLPGQSDIPAKKRRSQIIVSYDAYTMDFVILNTPDYTFKLNEIGGYLTDCLHSDRLQIIYDPDELTLGCQGVITRSLGTVTHGGKTISLFVPPICHFGNNLSYEDVNFKKLQISYVAASGPSLLELQKYADQLSNGKTALVNYRFEKCAYDQNGQLQNDYEETYKFFVITVKLTHIDFDETLVESGEGDSAEQNAETTPVQKITVNKTKCTVSGIIQQIITFPDNAETERYKINPREADTDLFRVFNFIKIQHWQVESDYSPTANAGMVTKRAHTVPPYVYRLSSFPERAAISHILGKTTAEFGAFPYVPASPNDWAITQATRFFDPYIDLEPNSTLKAIRKRQSQRSK